MTIDEAIKYLESLDGGWPLTEPGGYYEAIKLGIEALKQESRHRKANHFYDSNLLPGETYK